jgi:hypothetical protein
MGGITQRRLNPATISLWKYPGASELTRMLLGPSSRARVPSSCSRAYAVRASTNGW